MQSKRTEITIAIVTIIIAAIALIPAFGQWLFPQPFAASTQPATNIGLSSNPLPSIAASLDVPLSPVADQAASLTPEVERDIPLKKLSFANLPDSSAIPSELDLVEEKTYSNREIAEFYNNSIGLYNKLEEWGRTSNYYRRYQRSCQSNSGLSRIDVQVTHFNTIAGADLAFEDDEAYSPRSPSYVGNKTDNFGDRGMIEWSKDTDNCEPTRNVRQLEIRFRSLNINGRVFVEAIQDTIQDDELLRLGNKLAGIINLRLTEMRP